MPGFHTRKALCHTALSDITLKSSSSARKLGFPHEVPGTLNSGSLVCELKAGSHQRKGTFWLMCIFNNVCVSWNHCFSGPFSEGKLKYLGHMSVMVHVEQHYSEVCLRLSTHTMFVFCNIYIYINPRPYLFKHTERIFEICVLRKA